MNSFERAPEEYPPSLGLAQPDFIRCNFDPTNIVIQAENSFRRFGHVQMLAFWGVGWRDKIITVDRLGMAHLAVLVSQCQRVLLRGVRLTLLIGDNHGAANEIPASVVTAYSSSIESLAAEFGMQTLRLSALLSVASHRPPPSQMTAEEQRIFESVRPRLERSARNLNPTDPERRARNYFLVRHREAPLIAGAFPYAILANSDMPDRAPLAPNLPSFWIYMLPGKRWRKLKPWFVDNLILPVLPVS